MNPYLGDPDDCDDASGQLMLDIAAHIHRSGFMLIMVGSGACSVPGCDCEPSDEQWSYSIGLVEQGLPELVITGLASAHALYAANFVYSEIQRGGPIVDGEVTWFDGVPLRLDQVGDDWLDTDPGRMGQWIDHYAIGRSELTLPAVRQIVWGDDAGRFPDDRGCDPLVRRFQPLLADDPYSFPSLPRGRAAGKRSHPSRARTRRRPA
jgi:hypothetical protein